MTCIKAKLRGALAPECRARLARAEAFQTPQTPLQSGVLDNALARADHEFAFPHTRVACHEGSRRCHSYLRVFRGVTVRGPRARLGLHVSDWPEGTALASHVDFYDVILVVVRGRCVFHTDRERWAVEAPAVVVKPAGVALGTRAGEGGCRRLVWEVSLHGRGAAKGAQALPPLPRAQVLPPRPGARRVRNGTRSFVGSPMRRRHISESFVEPKR